MEMTFSIIKPDATKRNITGGINKIIEENNLKIVAQKKIKMTINQAKEFYSIHSDKPFFNDLIDFMTSEPVVLQVLYGKNAIENYRKVMGATNPENAEVGTIRKSYGLNVQENSVHGSDSKENAEKEISFFFSNQEIFI
ncbi:MAG: nucleoside-diphosphate kinase [Pelagibacteraceae bacterium]|nr:nucleoside-diphosphate kinase [Pelagibacteraceae bacterium]|tara:strand:- start:4519 stop:4935 length:417 start_codon:yes stop_codon:yes gene_type:complete